MRKPGMGAGAVTTVKLYEYATRHRRITILYRARLSGTRVALCLFLLSRY